MRRASLLSLALLLAVACGGSGSDGAAAGWTDSLLAVNGTRLFVHREGPRGRRGSEEPILVVHGGPVLDHGYLVGPLRPLADDHELVFYDQRLSGRSAGRVDSATVTLATFVDDIEAIRRELGLGRIHLLGHSWGGLLAVEYALAHPEELRSLILVSPMPPSVELWQREEQAASQAVSPSDTAGMGALRSSEAYRRGDPDAVERMLRLSFRGQLAEPSLADSLHFHVEDDYRERSRQFGYLLPELNTYDLTDSLPEMEVPTLVVYGSAEAGGGRVADTLGALLPRASVEEVPDAGHFSFLERPRAFLGVVREFLEGVADTGGGPRRPDGAAGALPDSVVQELIAMGVRDQEVRQGLRPESFDDTLFLKRMLAGDSARSRRLRGIVDRYGWPDRSRAGEAAASSAFLVLQHSPFVAFQERMAPRIEDLARSGSVDRQAAALLTDRVLMHRGEPQRYGTQFYRDGARFVLYRVEDPEGLDERRAAMGLPSLAEYMATLEELYGAPAAREP